MAIIDILSLNVPATFTIDKSVVEVPVVLNNYTVFKNPVNGSRFRPGENYIIRRIIPRLPYQFGQGTDQSILNFKFYSDSAYHMIPELSSFGLIYLPRLCEPMELDIFIKAPNTKKEHELFLMDVLDINVSMVNIPGDFNNGDVLKFDLFLTVEHAIKLK